MTFLERLRSHKGDLLRLKTELYWYDRGVWDRSPDRVCLILDADQFRPPDTCAAGTTGWTSSTTTAVRSTTAAAFLLIDGQPQWVWVVEKDVELL
jgi:hypothetical protein